MQTYSTGAPVLDGDKGSTELVGVVCVKSNDLGLGSTTNLVIGHLRSHPLSVVFLPDHAMTIRAYHSEICISQIQHTVEQNRDRTWSSFTDEEYVSFTFCTVIQYQNLFYSIYSSAQRRNLT